MILIGLTSAVDKVDQWISKHFMRTDILIAIIIGILVCYNASDNIPVIVKSTPNTRDLAIFVSGVLFGFAIWGLWTLVVRPILNRFTYG